MSLHLDLPYPRPNLHPVAPTIWSAAVSLGSGERLREANSINTSLSALGTVMNSLASKLKHIPFRNSKLTELLADSLSGNAKVCMLVHVAPECTSCGETISTLNFGSRVSEVTLGKVRRAFRRVA